MRILIVDDDYVSRTQLKSLLSAHGDCDCVFNGALALKFVEQAHSDRFPYRLIALDVDMPEMKGQDVVRALREWERANQFSPAEEARVLMVSGVSDGKTIVGSFREGCEGYLVKPATPTTLRAALAKVGL